MKGKLGILMVIAALYPLSLKAGGISAIVATSAPFAAEATYAVGLPQAQDDVVYTVKLTSEPVPSDAQGSASSEGGMEAAFVGIPPYIIEWQLPRPDGATSEGFLATFPGHHYRYRDHRLQEYHWDWDSVPFTTRDGGVQRAGQFVELLPFALAAQLAAMEADSTFAITPVQSINYQGKKALQVRAVQSIGGAECRTFALTVDAVNGLPLRLENEYNPGQISEQTVSVTYTYPEVAPVAPTSEAELQERFPEVFEKYRESNYAVENLRGLPLPQFSLPTTTGERYTHHRLEKFAAPTVIAIIDPTVASTSETVATLRQAMAQLPRHAELILAFTTNNVDAIEEAVGTAQMGEHHLMGARSLARACGVTSFPTFIVVDADGQVADVLLGVNKELASDVIQSVAVL